MNPKLSLTDEQIDAVLAGCDLDALIAMHLFNYQQLNTEEKRARKFCTADDVWIRPDGIYLYRIPRFSTNVGCAWMVVDRVSEIVLQNPDNADLNDLTLSRNGHCEGAKTYTASFYSVTFDDEWYEQEWPMTSMAETAEVAISRAALKVAREVASK